MKNKIITERFEFLHKYLELPDENTFVDDCSNGKKRLVSFISSIIHNPEILILDEPTVGLDAVLRDKIWKLLQGMVALQNTSVILTTHYIEEAKYSHCVSY